jgi:hypothetical protein
MTLKEELAYLDRQEEDIKARRREIYRQSLKATEDLKVCSDSMAKLLSKERFPSIKYPINVTGIDWGHDFFTQNREGACMVRVRPCGAEYTDKTFLGILLGEVSLQACVSYNPQTGVLHASPGMLNPVIFIPSLNRLVFGCESWWGRINSEKDMAEITDETINSAWYVQALKRQAGVPDET